MNGDAGKGPYNEGVRGSAKRKGWSGRWTRSPGKPFAPLQEMKSVAGATGRLSGEKVAVGTERDLQDR